MAKDILKIIKIDTSSSNKAVKDLTADVNQLDAAVNNVGNSSQNMDAKLAKLEKTQMRLEGIAQISGGLAGGFSAVTGVMSLFNLENENATKLLVKLQAALAIAQGVGGLASLPQGIMTTMKAFKGASVAAKGFIASLRGVKLAAVSTGIGALVVGLGILIEYLMDTTDAANEAADATDKLTNKLDGLSEETVKKKRNAEEEYLEFLKNNLDDEAAIREAAAKKDAKILNAEIEDRKAKIKELNEEIGKQSEFLIGVNQQIVGDRAKKDGTLRDAYISQREDFKKNIKELSEQRKKLNDELVKLETEKFEAIHKQRVDDLKDAQDAENEKVKMAQESAKKIAEANKEAYEKSAEELRKELLTKHIGKALEKNEELINNAKARLFDSILDFNKFNKNKNFGGQIFPVFDGSNFEEYVQGYKEIISSLKLIRSAGVDEMMVPDAQRGAAGAVYGKLTDAVEYLRYLEAQRGDLEKIQIEKKLKDIPIDEIKEIQDSLAESAANWTADNIDTIIGGFRNSLDRLVENFDYEIEKKQLAYDKDADRASQPRKTTYWGEYDGERGPRYELETEHRRLVEIQAMRDEEQQKLTENYDAKLELIKNTLGVESQQYAEMLDEKTRMLHTFELAEIDSQNRILANERAQHKERLRLDKITADGVLNTSKSVFEALDAFESEDSKAHKAYAIGATTIDTYQSATAAFKAMAGIPVVGPWLGGIAAAAATASGIATVKKIVDTDEKGNSANLGGATYSTALPNINLDSLLPAEQRNILGDRETDYLNRDSRVYVVESDIREVGKRVQVRENESTF